MIIFRKIKSIYQKLAKINKKYDVSSLAAINSFYMIITLFSLFFLFMQIYNFFSKEIENFLLTQVVKVLSSDYEHLINQIIPVFKFNGLFGIVLINLMWSSSKIIMAQKKAANKIYSYESTKTSILVRINSFLMFAMLIAIIVFELIFIAYLNRIIFDYFGKNLYFVVRILQFGLEFIILFSLILLSFMYVTPVRMTIKRTYRGALFSSIGFFLISNLFLLFIKYFFKKYFAYGFVSIISLMFLWIYLVNIILIGGIIYNYKKNELE